MRGRVVSLESEARELEGRTLREEDLQKVKMGLSAQVSPVWRTKDSKQRA